MPYGFGDLSALDLSFGLSEFVPGFKHLFTISGPFEFARGFVNGTQMMKNNDTHMCDNIIFDTIIPDMEEVRNLSISINMEPDGYQAVFIFFDISLLMTRLLSNLHPFCFHCWNSGDHIYLHYYDIVVVQNGDDYAKPYMLNLVYNFGAIFDAMREVVLFFIEDPRGLSNNVHDAGYNLGLVLYFFITPNIVDYETYAINHNKVDYDQLSGKELKDMNK